MKNLVIAMVLATFLVACASKKPVSSTDGSVPEKSAETAPSTDSSSSPTSTPTVGVDPLNDPKSLLATRSLYYPLDGYAVQAADEETVQEHAKYLAANPGRKIRVEGNADERGSTEYNLALGQRRADGVKKMLVLGGAKSSQIETASYGEEKPKAEGHGEAAWSQNRRADLNY